MSKNTKTKPKVAKKESKDHKGKKDKSKFDKTVSEEKTCILPMHSPPKEEKKKVKSKPSKTNVSITKTATCSFSEPVSKTSKKSKEETTAQLTATTPTTVAKAKSTKQTPPTTPPPVKKEPVKWAGEEAAVSWARSLEKLDLLNDYQDIKAIPTQDERCKIWAANMNRNRHPDYKCYDDNRVIVQMSKSDYINATKVNIPNFPRVAILSQIPKLTDVDAVEEFWKMIFTEQCTNVHIIAQQDEIEQGFEKLFGQEAGKYFYANGFFVNTKKVEKNTKEKMDLYVVELLPEGCSNSLVCQLYLHSYWKHLCGPFKFFAPVRAAGIIGKTDIDSNPVALVSLRGSGRNATLLTLAVVAYQFGKGSEPKIKDIVRTIREQRPMSVDSYTLYVSLHLTTGWMLKSRVPNSEEIKKKVDALKTKYEHTSSTMSCTTDQDPTKEH